MSTARDDYHRFIRWLHDPDRQTTDVGRSFANLVLAHFEAIRGTARQRNSRSMRLAELARAELHALDSQLPQIAAAQLAADWPWTRLRRLEVGPFRGFREPHPFDLDAPIVLCYGPNGSGKSSFCEALEYALLGSVEEAQARRLAEADYLANVHAGRFAPPVLTAGMPGGQEVVVGTEQVDARFCFIEKNRIDAFSRIAARPPARRTELIATLFGMDAFNDFVDHFNESMDAVLVLGDAQQRALEASRQTLTSDHEVVAAEPRALADVDASADEYARRIVQDSTADALRTHIGGPDAPARLHELDARLDTLPPATTGLTAARFRQTLELANQDLAQLTEAERVLRDRRDQVSYRDLFAALQALREIARDQCPACLTPLAATRQNPFERADAGIAELAELAGFEADVDRLRASIDTHSHALRNDLEALERFIAHEDAPDHALATVIRQALAEPAVDGWWTRLTVSRDDPPNEREGSAPLLAAFERAAERDRATNKQLSERQADVDERNRLNDARVVLAQFNERKTQIATAANAARQRIAAWTEANADLIRAAEQEREHNTRDLPIKAAYDDFVRSLHQFRRELPGLLMADLNQVALELYNEFNRGDRPEDLLAELRLPLTGEERIEIAFRGRPERFVDALAVLSEGHVRCLGLSILLAKALSVGCPAIIFDDAINAIDHDHRSGIRAAIFESDRFRETQMIVTCHSPEFIKDIENCIPREIHGACRRYVLRHHDGDHQPRVTPDAPAQRYLARAEAAIAIFDPRDALSNCRRALEMLSHKAWRWMESHRVGDISVLQEGPERGHQLRALCDAIRKKLVSARTFVHPSKEPLIASLEAILGIPEQNLIWTLLNKGTHEEPDRDDFDLELVRNVLATLDSIDRLEMRPGR